MKKLSQFSKKIFTLSLVGMLAFGVFSANANANLKVIPRNLNAIKSLFQQKGNYKVHGSILDKNGKQSATGRYANTTPDGKVKWNEEKEYKVSFTDADGISKNITLDGKKVSFPMKFSALGQKYAEFANVDFSKFKQDMIPIIVENTKNKMKMLILDTDPDGYVKLDYLGYKQKVILADLYEEGKNMIGVGIDTNDKKIVGLVSGGAVISKRDLKINGIGVGSTFNEMYAKFGSPAMVQKFKTQKNADTTVGYQYLDKNGNMWFAFFTNNDNIIFNKKYVKTKPNVITSVNIYCYTNNK